MAHNDPADIFQQAISCHQAGQLDQARSLYHRVLKFDSRHGDALNLLAVIGLQTGDFADALAYAARAVAIQPGIADYQLNLGQAYKGLERWEDAAVTLGKAAGLAPGDVQVQYALAETLERLGRNDEALGAYLRIAQAHPDFAEAHSSAAGLLLQQGRLREAEAACRAAIRFRPDLQAAHAHLGMALAEQDRLGEAIDAYQMAMRSGPPRCEILCNFANALARAGRLNDAEALCRRAIKLKSDFAPAYSSLASISMAQGRLDEAEALGRKALALKPDLVEAHANLGAILGEMGQYQQAIAAHRQTLALKPDHPAAHWNLACALLLHGELEAGWPEYEWRWRLKDHPPARVFAQPQWRGEDVRGKRILIHAEQGFGDTLQFVRYVPMVADRGGTVILETQGELGSLLQSVKGVTTLVARGESLPDFDLHCPLLSLPLAFGTTLQTIPAAIPYLHPQEQTVGEWQARLGGEEGRPLRVGLVWAGRTAHRHDQTRSMTLEMLEPLAGIANVQFYSLQKGREQSRAWLIDHTALLTDFAQTAALIANLDLVIGVDTAVVHLAGAMGKPVWLLLSAVPEWRWLLDRPDTPWYPTMRLFRQKSRGDWSGVAEEVRQMLIATAAK